MRCKHCGNNMWHANMSDTYICSNKTCNSSLAPEELKQPDEMTELKTKLAQLESRVVKLENDIFYLKGQHGRC